MSVNLKPVHLYCILTFSCFVSVASASGRAF